MKILMQIEVGTLEEAQLLALAFLEISEGIRAAIRANRCGELENE